MSELVQAPESTDTHSIAEWIEAVMLVDGEDDVSVAEIMARFVSGRRPPREDIEGALGLIEIRSVRAPAMYPYRVVGERVVRCGHPDSGTAAIDESTFAFLKLACLQGAPWVLEGRAAEVGGLFDYPVAAAMEQWLGSGSRSCVFGWPPRDGRPSAFAQAVSWLADQLGLPDGDQDRPVDYQDGGVDCVVWKAAPDGRSGIPIWLVQASVEHDVVAKASVAIPLESWKRWIKFGAGPVTVFASAHDVPSGSNHWMQLNDLVIQVADRGRLLGLLNDRSIDGAGSYTRSEIAEWVSTEIDKLRNPTGDPHPARVRRRKRERIGPHADPRAR